MRYIESSKGIVFAPSQLVSHTDLVNVLEQTDRPILSAGHLSARYSVDQPWKAYGKSTGLGIAANTALQIPDTVWAGICDDGFQTVIYSTNPDLLQNLQSIEKCSWGLTAEGLFGECAVYAPLHSRRMIRADEVLGL